MADGNLIPLWRNKKEVLPDKKLDPGVSQLLFFSLSGALTKLPGVQIGFMRLHHDPKMSGV